jgi:hypothetical protein
LAVVIFLDSVDIALGGVHRSPGREHKPYPIGASTSASTPTAWAGPPDIKNHTRTASGCGSTTSLLVDGTTQAFMTGAPG